uniref:LNR domain-containing protein n=1 Tax=Stomoxys calcitrans TaxID=35570 RepID=A0A1I8PQB2_STOCA
MNLRRKSKSCLRRRHTLKLLVVTLLLFVATYHLYRIQLTDSGNIMASCQSIDVVYTWVNGSDPAFVHSISQFDSNYDSTRFDDKNELKYSLRSLEKYAPWIRHIYIITNGQIPKWLDLSNKRITIVPHEFLVTKLELLPVFSSAAIETFIHRIPNLSPRFLYLNDDIFLGSDLYPEDLYTNSEGVRVYQAWLAPDCALDCPWTYIGDHTCDQHCNIKQCQFDGGDCKNENNTRTHKKQSKPERTFTKMTMQNLKLNAKKYTFPLSRKNKFTNFRDMITTNKHIMNKTEMKTVVENFNKQLQYKELATEVGAVSDALTISNTPANRNVAPSYDIFSQSLIYTNMLLNRRYGFKARHVIGHVGFLLEKSIIEHIQKEFYEEILTTAKHRFRASDDLQFSFLYYNFLMEETYTLSVDHIFNEIDTDHSLTWSDREVRTFLARIFPLPLDWSAVRFFEEVIQNCTLNAVHMRADDTQYSTVIYERYEDSHLPTVTRDLVKNCPPLVEALESHFAIRNKYKFKIHSKRNLHSSFMMLTSNVTDVVEALDRIRRSPRKFNCINDNMDPRHEDNKLIRHLLDDFYLSLFPHRSQFELHPQYRNKFENWSDYMKWRRRRRVLIICIYGSFIIMLAYLIRSVFIYKAKLVRFCMQRFKF